MSPAILQLLQNGIPANYCLGVVSPAVNAPVVLMLLGHAATQQWIPGADGQTFTLVAGSALQLTFSATQPANGVGIVVAPAAGAGNQQWTFDGTIATAADPNFAIAIAFVGEQVVLTGVPNAAARFQIVPVPAAGRERPSPEAMMQ